MRVLGKEEEEKDKALNNYGFNQRADDLDVVLRAISETLFCGGQFGSFGAWLEQDKESPAGST